LGCGRIKISIKEHNARKNLIPAGALQLNLVSLPALQENWHFLAEMVVAREELIQPAEKHLFVFPRQVCPIDVVSHRYALFTIISRNSTGVNNRRHLSGSTDRWRW
jgi:hypothetical protein